METGHGPSDPPGPVLFQGMQLVRKGQSLRKQPNVFNEKWIREKCHQMSLMTQFRRRPALKHSFWTWVIFPLKQAWFWRIASGLFLTDGI